MEEQNKYYTPEIEDLYKGYEYEWGLRNMDDTLDHWQKKIIENVHDFASIPWRLENGVIRVPYLTKEQIEAEKEWEWSEKNGWFSNGETDKWLLNVGSPDKIPLWINMWNDDTGETYFGYCKSVNEFRKICKAFNIK